MNVYVSACFISTKSEGVVGGSQSRVLSGKLEETKRKYQVCLCSAMLVSLCTNVLIIPLDITAHRWL